MDSQTMSRAYDEVVGPLAKQGYRAIVPYLRGYGPTRFRDASAPRMAEQAAIGQDVIDFADALKIAAVRRRRIRLGRPCGLLSRRRCIRIASAPRCSIGGYTMQNMFATPQPAPPERERALWYRSYFNTERGRAGLEANRRAICRFLWEAWSPTWRFTDETYNRTAASFDNPDFVDMVIHSYRHRIGNAPGEPRFMEIEKRLATATAHRGADDHVVWRRATDSALRPAESQRGARRSRSSSPAASIEGVGHFMPRERPEAVSSALLELLASTR